MGSPQKTSFAQRHEDRYCLRPIGVVRSPLQSKVEAPRQPAAAAGITAHIELAAGVGFEYALEGIAQWERLWVVFLFDRNAGWRPKVLPPRSERRVGVFATRSPHRPNPIGLSVVRLVAVDGLVLTVRDVDILDGSPVLDLKPYVPYADAHPDARSGWLEARAPDPAPAWTVEWEPVAAEQARFVLEHAGVALEEQGTRLLALGPQPHPYRRIRAEGEGYRLALREWRLFFRIEGVCVRVVRVASGFRPAQLQGSDPALEPHRAFVARFAPGHAV